LIGNASRAREKLGWVPTIDSRELAQLMVEADIEALKHAGTPWFDKVRLDSWDAPAARGVPTR
jgi:GDPmannose 4,6-dehydratase